MPSPRPQPFHSFFSVTLQSSPGERQHHHTNHHPSATHHTTTPTARTNAPPFEPHRPLFINSLLGRARVLTEHLRVCFSSLVDPLRLSPVLAQERAAFTALSAAGCRAATPSSKSTSARRVPRGIHRPRVPLHVAVYCPSLVGVLSSRCDPVFVSCYLVSHSWYIPTIRTAVQQESITLLTEHRSRLFSP